MSETIVHSYRYSVSGSLHVGTSSATSTSVSDTGMLFHMTGPAHEVINSYEIDRNVLKAKENEEKTGTDDWSK